MDPPCLRVKVSGPLLSKLLHERYRNSGNCGGLLYGEIITGTRSEITDSQHITKSEDFICIQDYLPMTNRDLFNSNEKSLQTEAWGDEKKRSFSSCIGMYKIRNSAANLSLLEKSFHRKLHKELHQEKVPRTNLVSLLITTETNFNATCLNWKVNAFVQDNSQFLRVKFEVSNLQGSVCDLYMTNPNPMGKMSSPRTGSVLQSFQSSLTESDGGIKVVEASRKVTQDLISELDTVFSRLEVKENALKKLLVEQSKLLEEWNALLAKKELKHLEEAEKEYQAEKRRSLDDIKRRSPIVLLEKIDMQNPAGHLGNASDPQNANSLPCKSIKVDAVCSAKSGPKRNIADHESETMKTGTDHASVENKADDVVLED